ncbi:uncharacterized protein EAF02_009586 [Botrytis sinoallii]|uniref:uncharacterized protein n=1 Tax=Botrytis sinoallii TaxID=1463999 RepID=UPI0018FF5A72|nr:uncharacterized protein EAF02_009586 [Botrytis sinoallii]KAF7868850.1 hypothetical protein EAF02_009586 [Botrytis sinoallii]
MPFLKCPPDSTPKSPTTSASPFKPRSSPAAAVPTAPLLLIPSSTGVGFSPYLMHRSKTIYGDDANIFRPER